MDTLSQRLIGRDRTSKDSSNWAVSEDWESSKGLVNDMFGVDDEQTLTRLREQFREEPLFSGVLEAMYNLNEDKPEREHKRARHCVMGHMVDDGKLWRVADGKSVRARAHRECISQEEAVVLAAKEHKDNGHWGRDLTKLKLMDQIYSPRLDQSVITVLQQCPQCKNFGATHMHALLDPITQCHMFELLVADYLSLLKGKGGYHTVLLILDTFSQYMWGYKLKTHGMARCHAPNTFGTVNMERTIDSRLSWSE